MFGVLIIVVLLAYVVTITGDNGNVGDFCFFSLPENLITGVGIRNSVVVRSDSSAPPKRSKDWINSIKFHSSVFNDLVSEGYLIPPESYSLCVETVTRGAKVSALKEIRVKDAIGVSRKSSKPLVVAYTDYKNYQMSFDDNTFDFVFSAGAVLDTLSLPLDLANEIVRTMKPKGFLTRRSKRYVQFPFIH